MNKITVRPESRRTEIRFSKELQADFDKLIKECSQGNEFALDLR